MLHETQHDPQQLQQQNPQQLLASLQLNNNLQQSGRLPLASLSVPLLQQLSDQLQGLQQHLQQHLPHTLLVQEDQRSFNTAREQQQWQQQQHKATNYSQSDRTVPLFTLSEHTQQPKASRVPQEQQQQERNKLRTRGFHESPTSIPGSLCVETDAGGRQRVYRIRSGIDKGSGSVWEGFDMVRVTKVAPVTTSPPADAGSSIALEPPQKTS